MGDVCSELVTARCLFVVSGSCRSTHKDDERDVPQVQLLTCAHYIGVPLTRAVQLWTCAHDIGVPLTRAFRHRYYWKLKFPCVSGNFFDNTAKAHRKILISLAVFRSVK